MDEGFVCSCGCFGAAAPLSGYAMPRVADAGLVMTVTGEANRLLANDQAVITFTAEAQRPQAQDASDEIIKAGNAAIASAQCHQCACRASRGSDRGLFNFGR